MKTVIHIPNMMRSILAVTSVTKPALGAVLGALLIFSIPSARAQTNWTGAIDNDWNTAGNWSNGLPANGNGVATISVAGANVTMSASAATEGFQIGHTSTVATDVATLNISKDFANGYNVGFSVGQTGTSSRELNYGKVIHTAGQLAVGLVGGGGTLAERFNVGAASSSHGIYEFGGTQVDAPSIVGAKGWILVGGGTSGSGSFGRLSLKDYGTIDAYGDLQVGRSNIRGELWVEGGTLTIDIAGNFDLGHSFNADGELKAILTDDVNFSTIHVAGDFNLGTTLAAGGSNRSVFTLELDDSYVHVANRTYTIVSSAGTFNNRDVVGNGVFGNITDGQSLIVDGHEFIANYDYTTGANTFKITAIL
jgi:hypothetical protein